MRIKPVPANPGACGAFLEDLGEVLGASWSHFGISRSWSLLGVVLGWSREVSVGESKSHGAQARSTFRGRIRTAPRGEADLQKETFLQQCSTYADILFLPREYHTSSTFYGREAKKNEYYGSAVVKKEVNNTLLRATGTL
jgi:hypothetical protein